MDDAFTRRGFVGLVAAGAASLWLPLSVRADDALVLRGRWLPVQRNDRLSVRLMVKHDRQGRLEVRGDVIDVTAMLHLQSGRQHALQLHQEFPRDNAIPITRSGRRLSPHLVIQNEEQLYGTFLGELPQGAVGPARLELRAVLRGRLDDHPEPHRVAVAALSRLRGRVRIDLAART